MKTITRTGFLALLLALPLAILTSTVSAQDEALKARMATRLPKVDALKKAGLVGENSRGLLEARGSLSGEQLGVVSQENSDRGQLYAAIASKRGVSTSEVAATRAADIRQKAHGNVWVQMPDGSWKQIP